MSDIPLEMTTRDRPADPLFEDSEHLFRRVMPEHVDGREIAIEAIELPDMSVNREKYGPAEWAILHKDHQAWGVLAFRVADIPPRLLHLGCFVFTFEPKHVPLRYNYTHSEIWAFRDGEHIDAKKELLLDPDLHLRWRQQLLWRCRLVIEPAE